MPTYFARASGNINASNIWATTPSGTAAAVTFVSGDVLMANSFAITVNVSTDLGGSGQVRNDTTGGATAGGSFTLANGVTLTANVFAGSATGTCVLFSGTAGNSATIVGNCTGGAGSSNGANNASTGALTIVGNCTGGSGSNSCGVNNGGSGTLNITGNCTGGGASGAHGANNTSTGTLTIVGSVAQGGNANLTGGSSTGAFGANNATTGSMFITGPIYASEFDGGVGSANRAGLNFLTGPFYTSSVWGVNPNRCVSWRWATQLVNTTFIEVPTSNLTAKRNLVTPDNATNFPSPANVRSGITFGIGGELSGTCVVPNPAQVAAGSPVDNTIGTLVSPSSSDIATAVWSAATRTITGGTVDTLTNAPASVTPSDIWSHATRTLTTSSGPTAAEIRTEIDNNSTKLASIKSVTDDLDPITERLANCATTNIVGVLLAQAQS